MGTILVIEDEAILARNVRDAIQYAGHETALAPSGEEGVDLAATIRPNLVVTDYRLPGIDGLEVMRRIRRTAPATAVIIMTAHGDIGMAVTAMKAGASDFLAKPLDLHELCVVVERVLRHQSETSELNYFRERERAAGALETIVGNSPQIRDLRELIRRIAAFPAMSTQEPPCVLITGETGTGKDLVARAIHHAGPRRDHQFVHVNCAALPEHLVESELFGHVKGAFTDARSDKQGLFEVADQGTLFLDEIGHMPLTLQVKLLIVIDRRAIRPVGGSQERKVNVHLIAATNRRLEEAIDAAEFREDLYHRLRVLTIALPPLRDRGHDVELLSRHFLRLHASRAGVDVDDVSPEAMAALQSYDWPGNVRELMYTLERAVLFADGSVIHTHHLTLQQPTQKGDVTVELPSAKTTIRMDFAHNCPQLDEVEYQIILAALQYSSHNLSRASRLLGISRDAIRYRLEKFQRKPDSLS